jgi:HPt (histidine-containing phosphotransfer) domain-containing protein
MEAWIVPLDTPDQAVPIQLGQVAKEGEGEVPFLTRRILNFWVSSADQRWVLIMNVSNFSRYRGGVWVAPEIAPAPTLSIEERDRQLLTVFCSGAMLIMLLYQGMIFLRRRDDKAALALAAICFSVIVRNIGFNNFLNQWIDLPLTAWPHDFSMKLEYLSLIIGPFSCLCFLVYTFRSVKLPQLIWSAAVVGAMVLSALVVLAKPRVLDQLLITLQLFLISTVICCLYFIGKAVRLKEKGSSYTLIGILIPLLLGFWETYLFATGRGFNIATFGAVIFVFMQSQVLAKRFAIAFRKAEHLSHSLQKEVDQQTRHLRHIMRHVPQGIGTVGRSLHLAPTYSDSMRSYFIRHHLESQRFDSMICNDLIIDDPSKSTFPSTLEALIGEDSLSWNLNSHLLIHEARTRDNRDLAFEWNPIVKDGVVDEVLVTIRDVSELKDLRQKNLVLDREYEIFVAFSRLERSHAMQAHQQLVRLLEESRHLSQATNIDAIWSRRVLITLHTMKGNARQIGLKTLASLLHQEEQQVIEAEAQGLSGMEKIQKLSESAQRLQEYFELMKLVVERIFGTWDGIPDLDIEQTLRRQFSALWAQQETPGQTQPELAISGPLHLLQTPFREAFLDIWLHLLTNSFDHGLNTKGQLIIAGSRQKPKITLLAAITGMQLSLIYSDNGRGIHLQSVWDKAVALELVKADAKAKPAEIAALIFTPGFSTRHEISQTSGRGIGMDAVKTLLEAAGCKLDLQLEEASAEMGYYPFRLVMDGPLNQNLSLAQ